jgi:hypothetical protein
MTHEHLTAALRALRAVAHRAGVQLERVHLTVATKADAQRLYAAVADTEEPPSPQALGGDIVTSQEAILAWSGGEEFKGPRTPEGLDGAVDDVQWEIGWREAGPLG